jgi:hypothetical protein
MTEPHLEEFSAGEKLSRRSLVAGATFFSAAMAAIGDVAKAEGAGSGSFSNAAIALPDSSVAAKIPEERICAVRIARAVRAGPSVITEHATVAEMDKSGGMTEVLRQGTNEWGLHAWQRRCRRRPAHVCRRIGHAMVQGFARREATADQHGAGALLYALRRDAAQQHERS